MSKIRSKDLRIFVSSTSEDLKDYRAVARLVILDVGCDYFESARLGPLEGTDIPFVGAEIHSGGQLTSASLAKILCKGKCVDGHVSLATAAEYRERYLGDRLTFLKEFGEQ